MTNTIQDVDPEPIALEDRRAADNQSWASNVAVTSHRIVGTDPEGRPEAGAYVVWYIRVITVRGGKFSVYHRYSDFIILREQLIMEKPLHTLDIPELPPRTPFAKFNPQFLEQRRRGLEYFLKCVVLNGDLSNSHAIRQFFTT